MFGPKPIATAKVRKAAVQVYGELLDQERAEVRRLRAALRKVRRLIVDNCGAEFESWEWQNEAVTMADRALRPEKRHR